MTLRVDSRPPLPVGAGPAALLPGLSRVGQPPSVLGTGPSCQLDEKQRGKLGGSREDGTLTGCPSLSLEALALPGPGGRPALRQR